MDTQAVQSLSHERPAANYRTILGGAIGHFIEWYEFALYGFLGGVLAAHIFPATDPAASLIASFSAFAIGFLGRPIGAFVLSPLCDKIGRKKLLSLTILLAGLGSLAIALCPDYATIGIMAPIIVSLARLLQGFSAGGEFQIAITFLNEHAKPRYRAFSASPQTVCIGLGILTACAVAGLVTHFLPPHALNTWGWRLPFLLGAVMSLYGFAARRGLGETPAFEEISRGRRTSAMTILRSLAYHRDERRAIYSVSGVPSQLRAPDHWPPGVGRVLGKRDRYSHLLRRFAAVVPAVRLHRPQATVHRGSGAVPAVHISVAARTDVISGFFHVPACSDHGVHIRRHHRRPVLDDVSGTVSDCDTRNGHRRALCGVDCIVRRDNPDCDGMAAKQGGGDVGVSLRDGNQLTLADRVSHVAPRNTRTLVDLGQRFYLGLP
jgi:MFS family permease